MAKRVTVRSNEYHDSIQLMRVSQQLHEIEGVSQAMVSMATDINRRIFSDNGFVDSAIDTATVDDMLVAVEADTEELVDRALETMDELFRARRESRESRRIHRTFESALSASSDANLCVITVPGDYAYGEARKALEAGLHVFIFSDNVPLHQDRELKEFARSRGLLCMGPDCGVANVNGVALGTSSIARKGCIGIAGASGSGTQQIAVLVDKQGLGVSHALGVGGKDLKDEVGGIGMLTAIDTLEEDVETKVIVLVSRTPGAKTLPVILGRVKKCAKPVVVYFIGGDPAVIEQAGATPATDSEDAANKAVDIARGRPPRASRFDMSNDEIEAIIAKETSAMAPEQRYVRGLFCGGTFCEEAMTLLTETIGETYSNVPLKPELKLADSCKSKAHSIIDLGDEEFTVGRPHPAIDPEPVRRAILREMQDSEVAVLLLDFILGPALNPDPVGSVIEQIRHSMERSAKAGGHLTVVASVCGTDSDPQNLYVQESTLREAGVVVMPSNAQAARIAGLIAQKVGE